MNFTIKETKNETNHGQKYCKTCFRSRETGLKKLVCDTFITMRKRQVLRTEEHILDLFLTYYVIFL